MILEHIVQDHMVLDHKSRPKSQKSILYTSSSSKNMTTQCNDKSVTLSSQDEVPKDF